MFLCQNLTDIFLFFNLKFILNHVIVFIYFLYLKPSALLNLLIYFIFLKLFDLENLYLLRKNRLKMILDTLKKIIKFIYFIDLFNLSFQIFLEYDYSQIVMIHYQQYSLLIFYLYFIKFPFHMFFYPQKLFLPFY